MKQVQKLLDLETALRIFAEEVTKVAERDGPIFGWDIQPKDVFYRLVNAAEAGDDGVYTITYNKASCIMEEARSPKMVPSANRGINAIKERWRHSYIN